MSKPKKISEQVRQAIKDSGLSRYRIAQDTGIDESALAKFFNRKRGMNIETLDVLGEYLGLELVPRKQPTKQSKSKNK